MNLHIGSYFIALILTCEIRTASIKTRSDEETSANNVWIPNLGSLTGTKSQTFFTKRPIHQFLGINYALPPSRNRRFQPPEPFGSWEGDYNATLMRQPCPQVAVRYYPNLPPHLLDVRDDIEDCLVLNVFSPKIPKTQQDLLLPVLFFIHGGSFYMGSAQDFTAEFLLERDVLLVVPQYRLGPLGFSSLQTDSIAGNAGMLDIVLALEWVRDNIRWFGGDPNRVTVAGQSAGAAAASALLVSSFVPPGLFDGMIVQSGSVEASWAVSSDPATALIGIAREANCFSSDHQEIADCLRKTPVQDLLTAHIEYITHLSIGESKEAAALIVQKAGAQRFLVEDPVTLLSQNKFTKVPIMAGTTRDDGSASLAEMLGELPSDILFNREMTRKVLKILSAQDMPEAVVDFYHNKYFINATKVLDAAKPLYDIFGVFTMKAPTVSIARRMRSFMPTFVYSFNFKGNVSKLGWSEPEWDKIHPVPIGVAHSDELGYLFPNIHVKYSSRELKMVRTMVDLWTNFVIYGTPAPAGSHVKWSAMSNDYGPYVRIEESLRQYDNVFSEYEVTNREGYKMDSSPTAASSANILTTLFTYYSIVSLLATQTT